MEFPTPDLKASLVLTSIYTLDLRASMTQWYLLMSDMFCLGSLCPTISHNVQQYLACEPKQNWTMCSLFTQCKIIYHTCSMSGIMSSCSSSGSGAPIALSIWWVALLSLWCSWNRCTQCQCVKKSQWLSVLVNATKKEWKFTYGVVSYTCLQNYNKDLLKKKTHFQGCVNTFSENPVFWL